MNLPRNSCELCKGEAFLYCYSDSAFLCWDCDRRVHAANFLVSRHLRHFACSSCRRFALPLSGSGSANPIRSLCRSCNPDPVKPSASSSSSSSCVTRPESETESESEAESEVRVMERWGEAMGLRKARWCADVAERVRREVAGVTASARAAMAGALWHVAREWGGTCDAGMVRRLERCSGVSRRVILLEAGRVKHALWKRRKEEGCGDSCP